METVAEKFGQEKPGIEHVRGFCRVLVRTKAKKNKRSHPPLACGL